MSNTKVYGFCDAGCRRRVPTYEEFEASVTHKVVPADEDGKFYLDAGQKYKIFATNENGISNCTLTYYHIDKTFDVLIQAFVLDNHQYVDTLVKSFEFRLLEAIVDDSNQSHNKIIYEIDGVQHTKQATFGHKVAVQNEKCISVEGATQVLLPVSEGIFKAEKGDKGDKGDKGEDGKDGKDGYIYGFYTEEFVPPNILEGLTLTKTVGASLNDAGEVVTTQYSGNYTAINEKIDVIAGFTYKFPKFFGVARYFYSNGTVSEQILIQSGDAPEDHEITIPDSVTHIRIAYAHTSCTFTGEIYRLTMTTEEQNALLVKNDAFVIQPMNLQSPETKDFVKKLAKEAMPDTPFEADESAFVPPNILDGLSLTYSEGSSWGSGGFTSNQYTSNYTAIQPTLDVLEGHTYKIPKFYGVVVLYDAEGKNGTTLDCADDYNGRDFEFTIPEGKAKIGIAYVHNNISAIDKVYRLTMTTDEANSLPIKMENFSLQPQNIQSEETKKFIRNLIPDAPFEADESAFVPPNILDGLSLTYSEGSSWGGSGFATNQYTSNYTAIQPALDVLEGHTYKIPKFYGIVMLYDANGKNGTQLMCTNTYSGDDFEFTIPEGKAKIGIAYVHSNISAVDKVYRLTMTAEEENALPVKNDNFSIQKENIKSEETVSLLAPLKDKVIVNFGDSIFGNARPPEDISTRLAELTGATVHNCGFGGCRMAEHPISRYDAFSMYRLADAITSGDFTLQDNALLDTEGVPAYFAETVALLKTIDFNKVDIITIAYGVNDWSGAYNAVGDYILNEPKTPLDTTHLKGAFRYSIETILNKYPQIRIFVCSMCYGTYLDASNNFVEDTNTKVNATFTAFNCMEQIKAVADEYNLPFIDNYHIGINKVNRLFYFPVNDGVHHNINGRRLLAEHIAKELF